MSDNENLEEKSGTEELKQKQADHRPLIEKAAEAASDIERLRTSLSRARSTGLEALFMPFLRCFC